MDNLGNLWDALIFEPERNEFNNMIIQIKDLTDSTPLPHIILREEINYIMKETQPLERWLVEYKDQISQTEDVFSILKNKQLFLEYHPLSDAEKNWPEDSTDQSKVVVAQTPRKSSVPTKKIKMGFNHIPIYEGEEDPKFHWFVCEFFLDADDITDEDKKMAQFRVALRHHALTWFMNYTENQTRSKVEIKNIFLIVFKF